MPKWFQIQRLARVRLRTYLFLSLCTVATIQLLSFYGYYNYDYLDEHSLKECLYMQTNPKLVVKPTLPDCKYDYILQITNSIHSWDIPKKHSEFLPTGITNGSYSPENCKPLFSVAILVTYRNRQSQLDIFIPYIHNFLRQQNIHYKIYVIEQQDEKPWNKGTLYNIGAKQAILDKFPCLILHDVDLLPLDLSNLYVCLKQPRHMSASIDKFRFVLIYKSLVGGVLAIMSDQYQKLNGFSNRYEKWGGEDDDFAGRIESHGFEILRFPPHMSRYTMLKHKQEIKNANRHKIMAENAGRTEQDGLNSVQYETVSVKTHLLFTMIAVTL